LASAYALGNLIASFLNAAPVGAAFFLSEVINQSLSHLSHPTPQRRMANREHSVLLKTQDKCTFFIPSGINGQ